MLDWMLSFWGDEPEVVPADETPEEKTKREQRAAEREEKRQDKANKARDRRAYRIEKIKAVTAKALAVGVKRKWLVFLIGAVIAAFAYFKFVGF
jgi:hypothetical protein